MKCLIRLLLAGVLPVAAFGAGRSATGDKGLLEIVELLKSADDYAFKVTVISEVRDSKADPKSRGTMDTVTSINYASKADFVQFQNSPQSLFFADKAGRFHVYDDRKTVLYQEYKNDSVWQAAKAELLAVDGAKLIDSILLHNATIIENKASKGQLTYKLGYPKGSLMRSAELVFNRRTHFFTSISYEVERPAVQRTKGAPALIARQKTVMSNYDHHIPADAAQIVSGTSVGLKSYLERRYPDYILRTF